MTCLTVRAPSNPVKSPLPFAALPHALRRDPRLNPRAVVLAAALLEFARDKASCWPGNGRLGEAAGCKERTVQQGLRRLEEAGWIVVERGAKNPTHRLIRLAWRRGGGAGTCGPPPQDVAPPPPQVLAPEASLKNEGEEERPVGDGSPDGSLPSAEDEDEMARLLARGDVIARLALANRPVPPPCPSPEGDSQSLAPTCKPAISTQSTEKQATGRKSFAVTDIPISTQIRKPASPLPVVSSSAQVPGRPGPTMRKPPRTQRCVSGGPHLLGDVIRWPPDHLRAASPPPRPTAGP